MYHNSYGNKAIGQTVLCGNPSRVKANLLNIDYSAAEARCPQRMPIGGLWTRPPKTRLREVDAEI